MQLPSSFTAVPYSKLSADRFAQPLKAPAFGGYAGDTPPADGAEGNQPSRKNGFDPMRFASPTPNSWLMWSLGPVNRVINLKGIPLLRNIPGIRSIPGVTGVTNIRFIEFPQADLDRLKIAVNPNTTAFIGPNHPEFYTDWMLDKEVSSQVAPKMASWATHTVVNGMGKLAQKFWLTNNLIAQIPGTGGKDGKEYSVQWAMKGNAVLLHPEGTVHWTGDQVHKIFPGIVDMGIEADRRRAEKAKRLAEVNALLSEKKAASADKKEIAALETERQELLETGAQRPVYLASVVWKLRFNNDVTKGLHGEMAEIEKKLGLPSGKSLSLADRFAALQVNLLLKQEKAFGLPESQQAEPVSSTGFFARQERFRNFLITKLEERYGKKSDDPSENVVQLGKAIRQLKKTDPVQAKADTKLFDEIDRLEGFTAQCYNSPHLTQEHIAESLKRIKQDLYKGGIKASLQRMIPRPVGSRTAYIRVGEPINLTERLAGRVNIPESERDAILEDFRQRLQGKLDEINGEIAPLVARYQVANPFRQA
jgi:hypothetical protein